MPDRKMNLLRSGIVAFVTLLAFLIGLFFFNRYIRSTVEQTSHVTLEESVSQQAFNFTSKIKGEVSAIQMLAQSLSFTGDVHQISADRLAAINENSDFDYLAVIDPNGDAVYSSGQQNNIADRIHFKRALMGETYISEPFQSRIRDATVIALTTPILYQGEIIGVLMGSHLADELNKLFLPSFDGKGYSYVTTNEGKIIAKSTNSYSLTDADNLFDAFRQAKFYQYDSFVLIQKKLLENASGHAKYIYNGQKRIVHYRTISVNDWNIFSIVPEDVILGSADQITFATGVLSFFVISVLVLLMAWILTIQKKNMDQLTEIAFVDQLTKGPTLAKFKLEAARFIQENPGKNLLMVKFDVDKFKLINRTLGFETGDRVIQNLAKALKMNTPGNYDRYARVYIDEFLVLHEYEHLDQLVDIRDTFQKMFRDLMGEDFDYTVRIVSGHYYMGLENCTDVDEAIEKANIAHRKAKHAGDEVCIYDESFIKQALQQKEIENRMVSALANHEFQVFLQPKYELTHETMIGAEALVRWKDGDVDLIYPNDFIPIFEENGFITKLDFYMFENTCAIIREWLTTGLEPVVVSVNFSRNHLTNRHFVSHLCTIADNYQIPRKLLEIELTETTIFDNEEILLRVLDQLHECGFTLSMDDFGTGYSSLGLLKNMPVDVIKIDRSFFTRADDHARSRAVLANVIKMARDLGIHTVAEGVETKEHVELLRELGCEVVQGYYYAKPTPANQLASHLKHKTE